MRHRAILSFFFLSLFLNGCTVNKHDAKDYIAKFYANKKSFEEIIIELKSSKAFNNRIGLPIRLYELNKELYKKTSQLDVLDIDILYSQCQGINYISLTMNWTKKVTVHLTKDSCDKTQTAKGYHNKTSEMIEVWGLGDDWLMWIDYDFI